VENSIIIIVLFSYTIKGIPKVVYHLLLEFYERGWEVGDFDTKEKRTFLQKSSIENVITKTNSSLLGCL
jgi:hypothetical protein